MMHGNSLYLKLETSWASYITSGYILNKKQAKHDAWQLVVSLRDKQGILHDDWLYTEIRDRQSRTSYFVFGN
jgi:hypothetical protein